MLPSTPLGPNTEDKLWAGLSYAGCVCCAIPPVIIFLLKREESSFIQFHTLQATLLGLCLLVIIAAFALLGLAPALAFPLGLALFFLFLLYFGVWVFMMIQGFTGKDVRIPILANFIDSRLMR